MSVSSRTAVYTGSFDPLTLGHLNVIERSSRLVDRLIVGIGVNIEKASLFTPDERVDLGRRVGCAPRQRRSTSVCRVSSRFCRSVRREGDDSGHSTSYRYRRRNHDAVGES